MNEMHNNRIVVDPNVMVGKPVIKGTRITVELILRQFAEGLTTDEILKNYPHLTKEDIRAVMAYATDRVEEETVYPTPTTLKEHAQTQTPA